MHDYFARREGGGRLAVLLGAYWGWPVTGGFVNTSLRIGEDWPALSLRDLGVRPAAPALQSLRLARAWSAYRSDAEALVYSGSYAPMAVFNRPSSRNILYCHTPPRFLYDQYPFYRASMTPWQRPLFRALAGYLRSRYAAAAARMDSVVANSVNVQRRVQHYLGLESVVGHPPCDVASFWWEEPQGYYLSTARLDPLKRVDLVIRAFRAMPERKLVVVSDGPERRRLERLANDVSNIAFLGEVDEKHLRELIAGCIGTIYVPRDEDFGMSPVESMAAGKPVIGVAEGGLLETVVDGQTGLLLPEAPEVDDLVNGVQRLTHTRAREMRSACVGQARKFETDVFLRRMREVVEDR